jgi:HlyD family secretion protein
MAISKTKIILSIPIIIAIVSVVVLVTRASSEKELIITGIVESTDVDVASKIAGRIDTIFVDEGQTVTKGQVLAFLESKEMDAKVAETKSLMDAAKSKYDMALNGARPEEKEAVHKLFNQSQYQFDLANKTYARFQNLYRDSVVSAQEKDQVEFQYKAAREQMEAAKAKLTMVLKGARSEEIAGAEALFQQAQNGYKEVLAYQQELTIKAPMTGELSKKIVDPGEVIASGYPIFTITNLSDSWVVLQLREDYMAKVKIGSTFHGTIPALGNVKADFQVTYIAPMGDFANWKPTNQKGDFDLKTFEVKLKPKGSVTGLRPGMTVNIVL